MPRERTLWERVDGFFFDEQPVLALVVCRFVFGICLFGGYVTRVTDLQLLFGPDGISGAALHSRAPAGWPQNLLPHDPFRWLHFSSSEALVWVMWIVLLISALAFAVGFKTRISGCVALLIHAIFHSHNLILFLGWGYLIKPYMAYVIMSRAGEHLSLDVWFRRRRGLPGPSSSLAPAWPLRLLQIHVCTMYAVAGWTRLVEPAWINGDMLFVALNWQWFSRFHFEWYAMHDLLRPLSMGAFILEPLAPILLWMRRIGPWWAMALIGMHIALEVLANIGWWQFMMIAGLTTFLPTSWLERVRSAVTPA